MVFREHELTDQDPNSLIFGHDDEPEHVSGQGPSRHRSRVHRRRARRNRRMFVVIGALTLVVVLVVGFFTYSAYERRYHPKNYSGQGTGQVDITVHSGDGANAIAATLLHSGVVASTRAFTNAAGSNSDASSIAPGVYRLRKQMSAKAALALLLDPSSRLSRAVVVFEGATTLDVFPSLAKALGVSAAAITSALPDALGNLPLGYPNTKSVEGFLYPATYSFDPGVTPQEAVQQMITKYIDEDRANNFDGKAKSVHLSPYAALIIASIAEKEAKMPADYARVARVILNRIAARMPLQIDATSAYAAKLEGLDPAKVIYNQIDSPYNTYKNDGLPPTPIANPGEQALAAAVAPSAGNWLYYVNSDAQGDLFFTNDEAAFEKAVTKCQDNHWGCG